MPMITPDFSEAPEQNPVPPGIYKARIAEVQEKVSQKGGQYLNWKLELFGGEGDAEETNNRVVFMMTMLSGKGAFKLRELMKACELEVGAPFDPEELIGKEVEVTLVTRVDQNGNTSDFPDVKAVRPLAS